MGENSTIQWTHHTFNGWIGCEKVSQACRSCYAERDTYPRVSKARGLPLWGADAHRHVTSASNWRRPIRWARDAAAAGERRRVFAHSLSDVCEDRRDLDGPRAWLSELIRRTAYALDWMLLTKRPQHFTEFFPAEVLALCWCGTTAETQQDHDDRWKHLGRVKAARWFLSCEPMLEDIELWCLGCGEPTRAHLAPDQGGCSGWFPDLVIVGGESGNGARSYDLEWPTSLIQQTRGTRINLFHKQVGAKPRWTGRIRDLYGEYWAFAHGVNPNAIGTHIFHLKDDHGGDPSEWPEPLRVREMPEVRA